jgi:hypothetical protein
VAPISLTNGQARPANALAGAVFLDVDWDKILSGPLPLADDELSWGPPGPPPRIWGNLMIFEEGSEEPIAVLPPAKEPPEAESPDDISGIQPWRTNARTLLSQPSISFALAGA